MAETPIPRPAMTRIPPSVRRAPSGRPRRGGRKKPAASAAAKTSGGGNRTRAPPCLLRTSLIVGWPSLPFVVQVNLLSVRWQRRAVWQQRFELVRRRSQPLVPRPLELGPADGVELRPCVRIPEDERPRRRGAENLHVLLRVRSQIRLLGQIPSEPDRHVRLTENEPLHRPRMGQEPSVHV